MHEKDKRFTKFFLCLGICEIIIALIASAGLGINLLATTEGEADIKLTNTSLVIGKYYADVEIKIDAYEFSGYLEGFNDTDYERYTYKESYQEACGNDSVSFNDTKNCHMRYAIWKWTNAFMGLSTTASCLLFLTGVFLLFLACCGEALTLCFCGSNEKDQQCCHCFVWCTIELWLMVLNVFVFLLFAFSWVIILGLKFSKNSDNVIESSANEALNDKENIQYYDFDFEPLKPGDTLWSLAVASFLSLLVSLWLLFVLCYMCCSNYYKHPENNSSRQPKNNSIQMCQEEAEV